MARDLFIGIVACQPDGLATLPDATYRFMDKMIDWSSNLGFETWLLSDEDETNPNLTGKYISEFIEKKNWEVGELPDDPHGLYKRRCIFIYFCGHGFSRSKMIQFCFEGKDGHSA